MLNYNIFNKCILYYLFWLVPVVLLWTWDDGDTINDDDWNQNLTDLKL